MTTYHCPTTQEPFDVDLEMIGWDDDGTALIDCPVCNGPVVDLTRNPWDAVSYREPHEIQIARPVSAGFGGSNAT